MSESGSPESAQSLDAELNKRIVRSSAWIGIGFGGARALSFVSMLVLVRLLEPADFGIVAVGMTLLAVVTQIQESGLGSALVHGRRHDPKVAAASVLVFAAAAGIALTVLTILLAPLYTNLLNVPEATEYVQVLALLLAIRGFAVTPAAILERDMDFRSHAYSDLAGAVVQVVVTIGCAVAGLGAWSLVLGQLAGSATDALVVWLRVPWRPSPFAASGVVLRELMRYGRYVSGTNVLVVVNTNVDNAVVARSLGPGTLGVYSVAWRLAELPNTVIALIVGRPMFSVYSQLQHDLHAVRAAYVQNMQRTMLFALPVTLTLGIAAEPIVLGLLGPEWAGAIDPLRLLAIFSLVRLLVSPSGDLLKGIGKPHLTMLIPIVFLATTLPSLIVLVPTHGSTGAALAMVIGVTTSGLLGLGITCTVLELRPAGLIRSLARPAACAMLVGVAVVGALPAADSMEPVAGLLLVVSAACISFSVALALFARPLLSPIRSALRRS